MVDKRLSGEQPYQMSNAVEGMNQSSDANYGPFPQNKYKRLALDLDGSAQQQALSRTKTNVAGQLNL